MVSLVIKNNLQLILLLLFWLAAGIFTGPVVFIVIPLSLFLIWSNEGYPELLFGFLFILILSDSLEASMAFAKSFKNVHILLLFLFFLLTLKNQTKVVELYKYFIPYFIFGVIGLIYSPVLLVSSQKLLSYILLFIIVPNYVYQSYKSSGIEFFRNLIYFLFAIAVIGFLLRFYSPELAFSHGGRLRGFFGNPNGLGIFLILSFILFAIINDKFPQLFSKMEKIIFFAVMFYLLYKTGSRTALLAVVLFYIFNGVFKFSTFFGFVLFFGILISIEFLIVNFPRLIVLLGMQQTFRMDTLEQGSGRLIAWEFAWQNIKTSLIVGKGFAYDEFIMRKNFELLSKAGHEGGVHNTYLIMWLNTGLLGLLAFLRGIVAMFMKGAKNSSYSYPALFAIMLSINFEPWLAASLNPYTILFLIIITILTEDIFNEETEDISQEDEEMETDPQVG